MRVCQMLMTNLIKPGSRAALPLTRSRYASRQMTFITGGSRAMEKCFQPSLPSSPVVTFHIGGPARTGSWRTPASKRPSSAAHCFESPWGGADLLKRNKSRSCQGRIIVRCWSKRHGSSTVIAAVTFSVVHRAAFVLPQAVKRPVPARMGEVSEQRRSVRGHVFRLVPSGQLSAEWLLVALKPRAARRRTGHANIAPAGQACWTSQGPRPNDC